MLQSLLKPRPQKRGGKVKYHSGILAGQPHFDEFETVVLSLTRGIPIEWVYAALGLGWRRRARLKELMNRVESAWLAQVAMENASSVAPGDGMKMLEAVCPHYSGAAPEWSRLDLISDHRSNSHLGLLLGVHEEKVRRWRTNFIFHPLTGERLIQNRGRRAI
jgi:hypothetical protein